MIKGILFDYGGTIDTNGKHWGELLWEMYQRYRVPVSKEVFRQAYTFGEKSLAINPLINPGHNFLDVLKIKVKCQFNYLFAEGQLKENTDNFSEEIKNIAGDCNNYAMHIINAAKPVLEQLSERYPLILVSNFYGNLHTVLREFGIIHFFKSIVESAVVGVRKPSPEIFSLGVKALNLLPEECVVIGDSYSKDIAPGHAAGCHTIWLKETGWGDDPEDTSLANNVIATFEDLLKLL
ncbi:MAG TPA: HAD family hydrolase [Ferruginibacter sp.]|nr:HAD family hydrolase [Ferruginibacter sp.]